MNEQQTGHANADAPLAKPVDMRTLGMPEISGIPIPPKTGPMGPELTIREMKLSAAITHETQGGATAFPSSLSEALIHKAADGYTVQFPGMGAGRTRHFRGVEFGSMRAALGAAIQWRNDQAATLTSAVEFPTGERIFWSDGEIDNLTERAALLEGLTRFGAMPDKGYQLLHYLRMAIVQVLPWNRWRRIGQVRAIPYDIAARFPAKRRQIEGRLNAFLQEEREEREKERALKVSVGDAVAAAEAKSDPAPAPEAPEKREKQRPAVAPSAAVAKAILAKEPTKELIDAAGSALAPVLAGFVRLTVEGMVLPLAKLVDEAAQMNQKRLDEGLDVLGKASRDIGVLLDRLQGIGIAQSSAPSVSTAEMEEVKTMHELITEELARVSAVAAELDTCRENIDTRLADLERAVFRLQSAALGGGAVAPSSLGPKIEPPEEPVRIQRRAVVPVIAIMGPLAGQFRQVEQRVGDAAELHHVENKGPGAAIVVPERCEWGINNRFGSHTQEAAMIQALGRDRVIYVGTGGISSMVRAVAEIVERVNREGGK